MKNAIQGLDTMKLARANFMSRLSSKNRSFLSNVIRLSDTWLKKLRPVGDLLTDAGSLVNGSNLSMNMLATML